MPKGMDRPRMSPRLAELPELVVLPPLLLGTTDDERMANPLTGLARAVFKLPAMLEAELLPALTVVLSTVDPSLIPCTRKISLYV